jgi:hypothetical protein
MTQVYYISALFLIFVTLSSGSVQNLRGVHFDVEPYTLAVWKTNQTDTFNSYLDLLDKISAVLNDTGLDFAVDLPFWYYQYNLTRNNHTRPYHEWVKILNKRKLIFKDCRSNRQNLFNGLQSLCIQ